MPERRSMFVCQRLLGATMMLLGLGCAAQPEAAPVGSWIHRGPRHILGSGSTIRLDITVGDDGPQVQRTVTILPNMGRGEPTVTCGRVEPLEVDGCWLRCGSQEPATFRFQGGRLVFPALVEESPGNFVFATEGPNGKVLRWSCQQDPRRVATGPATFPSAGFPNAPPQRYVATFAPMTTELVRLDFFDGNAEQPSTTFIWEERWGLMVLRTWALHVRQRYFDACDHFGPPTPRGRPQ